MSRLFVKDLAEPRPEPGGGAAAAYGVSLGLALITKVLLLEERRGTKMPLDCGSGEEMLAGLAGLATEASRLRDEDCRAYRKLADLQGTCRGRDGFREALEGAVSCPLNIIRTADAGLAVAAEVADYCRPSLVPDLQVAAEFLGAAVTGAYLIAAANFRLFGMPEELDSLHEELETALFEGKIRLEMAREKLQERMESAVHAD